MSQILQENKDNKFVIFPNSYLFFYYTIINLLIGTYIHFCYESSEFHRLGIVIILIYQIYILFKNIDFEEKIKQTIYSCLFLTTPIIPEIFKIKENENNNLVIISKKISMFTRKKLESATISVSNFPLIPKSLVLAFLITVLLVGFFLLNNIFKKKLTNQINCIYGFLILIMTSIIHFQGFFWKKYFPPMTYGGVIFDFFEIMILGSACMIDLFWDKLNLKPEQKAFIIFVLTIRIILFIISIILLNNQFVTHLEFVWLFFSLLGFLLWF